MKQFLVLLLFLFSYCFSFSEASKCREEVENIGPNPPPGRFIPQCDQEGDYQKVQSHGSTGYSWCVDPRTGEKVQGTDIRFDLPDCRGKCEKERQRLLLTNEPRPGLFVPICDKYGDYRKLQSSGSSGYSWCVHPKTGQKVQGTDVPPGWGTPDCREKCEKEREKLLESDPPPGCLVPVCDANGKYEKLQFHSSTGYSFCVDPDTGVKDQSTNRGPTEDPPNC